MAQSIPHRDRRTRALAYLELTKPRLTLLVMFAGLTGYYVASVGAVDVIGLVHTLVGIGLASAGAMALNQYLEREYDARMLRTAHRPLPEARLLPGEALAFGTLLALSSVMYLTTWVNWLTGALVAATMVIYLFLYTPLKRISPWNTVVGAIPGALPIVSGWVGARNSLDTGALILFAILYFWQFPHFLSIAWLYREDYRRAGYKMFPGMPNGAVLTNGHILVASLCLLVVSLLPTPAGLTGNLYLGIALLVGGGFLSCGVLLVWRQTAASARRLMIASFIYPVLLWSFMIVDKL